MDIENNLKIVVEKITSNFTIERIILFGSYAYGHPTTDSDIDLMVVMETATFLTTKDTKKVLLVYSVCFVVFFAVHIPIHESKISWKSETPRQTQNSLSLFKKMPF